MFRKIRISAAALLITGALAAQTSGIKVHMFDKVTNQPVQFANVVVEQGTNQVAGTMTDEKGYAELKPLDPGTYNVRAVFVGYHDYLINGVKVNQDVMAYIEIPMISVADTSIKVTVISYRVPLVSRDTRTGGIADSADIHSRASGGGLVGIAASVPGVYSKDVGNGDLNIRGGRADATQYIIDGQKVTADQGLGGIPSSMIDQIAVITGGTPAKYGDATGGIVEVNTLSGADHYFGSVQGLSSTLFDPFHYNDANFAVGGPIWSKKDSAHNKKIILDFVLGGEYSYTRDQNPTFGGTYFVNPTDLAAIEANPLTINPNAGFTRSAEYITSNQIDQQAWHQNNAQNILQFSGKINYHLSDNVKITVGGSYSFQTQHDWLNPPVYQMFNSAEDPLDQTTDYKGFIRLTQKFSTPSSKEKSAVVKNAFYSIQAEYSHHNNIVDNGNFGSNYFEYGYVGQFYQYRNPVYQFKDGSRGNAYYMQSYSDSLLTYKPGTLNPIEANYTTDVYNGLGASTINNFTTVQSNLGLMNGDRPGNVYSLWYNVGRAYGGVGESNNNHFRFSADFSAEIANNSIEVGFEYEQNSLSNYNINASLLWTLMRQLANFQLNALDTLNPILVKSGTYDTYNYNYLPNSGAQSQFDKSLREALHVGPTAWIQPDNYSPAQFQSWGGLSMFSAGDLWNQGNSLVGISYYGYDYKGNLLTTTPSIDDFFNQKDANGNLTYTMGAYRPIYMAGYIQDHFDIKSIVFDIGVRVEQFNANQYQLKDPYLLFPAKTAAEISSVPSLEGTVVPANIGSDYVVYVNNSQSPSAVVGYRNGNNWYDASGNLVSDPTVIATATTSGSIQPLLKDNTQTTLSSNAFTSYSPQTEVLPRLAFSFPITDKANFFAHYDILSQRPPGVGFNIFQPNEYLFIQSYAGGLLSNPALTPQRTTDYELGFTQVLNEAKSMALTFSAFYREFRDEIQPYRFLEAYPITYIAYSNISFGTVKGLAISYDLRRLGNWSDVKFRASYNLQFANGTGSGPNDGFNLISSGEPNLQIPTALSYDQRHTITANLDFHFSSGTNYDGPSFTTKSGKTVQVLSNAGFNINFSAGSGTPYTQWAAPTQQGQGLPSRIQLIGTVNGEYLPWQQRIDAKADKMFHVTIKGHPCQLQVYLEATNLLNTANVLNVYNYTGSATDDGFLSSALGKQTVSNQLSPQSFVAQYSVYEKIPTYFSLPRQARLGLVFNF
ncbi:MAG TPA: carboxypeptidase regulatory-like domain-containing protein [Bacteroidia bacterium]|jgi:hypothetical protein|nr:carboxypeptidase regulatory-like domain-containing protein [Bacteroidia bacterium]